MLQLPVVIRLPALLPSVTFLVPLVIRFPASKPMRVLQSPVTSSRLAAPVPIITLSHAEVNVPLTPALQPIKIFLQEEEPDKLDPALQPANKFPCASGVNPTLVKFSPSPK